MAGSHTFGINSPLYQVQLCKCVYEVEGEGEGDNPASQSAVHYI